MICKIDELKIYYEAYGDGIPLLMIHGYGIDHNVMTGCMEPIFKGRPGWKRIYLDLPGMGRTRASDRLKNSDDMLGWYSGSAKRLFLIAIFQWQVNPMVDTLPEDLSTMCLSTWMEFFSSVLLSSPTGGHVRRCTDNTDSST